MSRKGEIKDEGLRALVQWRPVFLMTPEACETCGRTIATGEECTQAMGTLGATMLTLYFCYDCNSETSTQAP